MHDNRHKVIQNVQSHTKCEVGLVKDVDQPSFRLHVLYHYLQVTIILWDPRIAVWKVSPTVSYCTQAAVV